jgi:sugar O-acyltransferase (sialic acid O-acetyltransferase NeuD family)
VTRPVLVIGAGGHGVVVADALLAAGCEVLGFLDRDPGKQHVKHGNLALIGTDSALARYSPDAVQLANGIGSTRSMQLRRDVFVRLRSEGWSFVTVVHPRAVVSDWARLAAGAQVMAGAVVQAGAAIGENSIVNTAAVVDHDCSVEAHCHIAPGATLSGGVHVGEMSHVGTGATIIEGRRLGAGTLVGAGAVVVRDSQPGETLVGVPARARSER